MMIAKKVPIDCLVHAPCIELNYYDQGSGEPLVFIHGLGGNADSWRLQMEALSKNYRVLAMDLRGHGQSGYRADEPISIRAFADDVVALLAKLGLGQAHICGLSMGGMIALEIFVRCAPKVKSLILIERWRWEYNTVRPHSALGYRPPAPEAIQVLPRDPGYARLRQDLWLDLTPILT